MPKLQLSLEDLAVESFDVTAVAAPGGGTVRGREDTDESCLDSCFDTHCARTFCYEYYCGGSRDGTCHDGSCACSQVDTCACVTTSGPETYNFTCPYDCSTPVVC